MNVNGIGTQNIINLYSINSKNKLNNIEKVKKSDTIEISNLGKKLSIYDSSDLVIDKTKRIQEIKEQIANGTYNIDSKETAKSIINAINEGKELDDR